MAGIVQANCTVRLMAAVRQRANINYVTARRTDPRYDSPIHMAASESPFGGPVRYHRGGFSLSPGRPIFDLEAERAGEAGPLSSPAPFRRIIMGLEVLFEIKDL